jgi:broad specificity phosphatase PhoE
VSCIENDLRSDYGLSEVGRAQALEAAQACGLSRGTVIFSSDFSRARQTAEIVRAHLDAPEVNLATALRERCFGDWEGSATDNYARVWAADETDSDQVGSGVEPAAAVLDRTTALIVDLDRRYSGRDILLVSHGDTLQILQAAFLRLSPTRHRRLPALRTAEIRQLHLEERSASPRLAASPRTQPYLSSVRGSPSRLLWTTVLGWLAVLRRLAVLRGLTVLRRLTVLRGLTVLRRRRVTRDLGARVCRTRVRRRKRGCEFRLPGSREELAGLGTPELDERRETDSPLDKGDEKRKDRIAM